MAADYLPRIVDTELDGAYAELPAVSIEGPKAVGKTATALRRARTTLFLDDPGHRELLNADPSRIDTSAVPVVLDEWQRYPPVWDLVRRSVDRDPTAGRFLLTGSAAPAEAPTHSGAGRIVQLHMRPLTLSERQLAPTTVSLSALLSGEPVAIGGDSPLDARDYAEEIVRSGFPAIHRLAEPTRRLQLDGYLDRIVEHDFPEQGRTVRRPATLRAWLRAYAAATATTTSYEKIAAAATPGHREPPSRATTLAYRETLTRLWILDQVEGWQPSRNPMTRLAAAPKHHLADPALAARLLGLGAGALIDGADPAPAIPRDGTLLGALFESLITLDVRTYAQAAGARVGHFRTRNGDREVDLIVQRDDGRIVALEIKLARSVEDTTLAHLRWLRDRLGDDLLAAAVLTTGPHAYRRADGIAVIPAALLGP